MERGERVGGGRSFLTVSDGDDEQGGICLPLTSPVANA
jgi:hypothetical protein